MTYEVSSQQSSDPPVAIAAMVWNAYHAPEIISYLKFPNNA